MKSSITACLVVYHEQELIERCLQSLTGVVDEIIVVHDGPCADRTVEIAEKYTDKIHIRHRAGMCEAHKVFAIEAAQSEWILMIDADEYLSEPLREKIVALSETHDVDGYEFLWPYCDGKRQFTQKFDFPYRLCLARKSLAWQWGFPHEPLRVRGRKVRLPLILEHWPKYNNFTVETFFKKQLRWIKIHSQYMWADPATIPRYNPPDVEYIFKTQVEWRGRSLIRVPYIFGKYVALQLYSGQWKAGFFGIRVALMVGVYHAALLLLSRRDPELGDRRARR